MSNYKVHLLSDDSELKARSIELNINGKLLITPGRALSFVPTDKNSESRFITNKKLRGINEIYLKRDFEQLDTMRKNIYSQTRMLNVINNSVSKLDLEKEVIFTFMHYDARRKNQRPPFLGSENVSNIKKRKNPNYIKTRLPTKDETDYLIRLLFSLPSDALIPPLLQGIDGGTYTQFLENFFEIIDSTTHFKSKPVMGIIPKVADIELDRILELYKKRDIRLFALDFGGGQPFSFIPHIIKIMQYFQSINNDYNEHCYLHGINLKFGRPMNKTVVPARDVLSYGIGIDSFGISHVTFGGSRLERLQGTPEQIEVQELENGMKNLMLFSRSDYGYHRLKENNELRHIFSKDDKDATYDLSDILRGNKKLRLSELRTKVKIFNAERHLIEAKSLAKEVIGRKKPCHKPEKKLGYS